VTSQLRLRVVEVFDAPLLLEWRNDAQVRQNSISTAVVVDVGHHDWLADKLASPDCRFWILERDGCPVGQIRYDRSGGDAYISLSVAATDRGQGLGSELLCRSADRACNELGVRRLIGIIKQGNSASLSAFARAGFAESVQVVERGVPCVRVERRCEPCPADLEA
jgi:UDP-2,4-diacetamido-2,4,6-trideoxy-beta-L-altropyranose hydrolase